jgi:hypothetical protein
MNKLTIDVESLTVESLETGPANRDCTGVSAGATRTCPL